MNDHPETITEDGEIVTGNALEMIDAGTVSVLARAEIDTQIATARKYPRNIPSVINAIRSMATIDEEAAAECCYALVRGKKNKGRNGAEEEENKAIEGPSIRLAELAAQVYGNCRISARVVEVNRSEKYVEAEGTFLDLQSNMASKATVRRRISTKQGYLFSDDMILVTSNAACSIAKRNAVLAGIPRAVYRPAYQAARSVIAGTVETLGKNRDKAIAAFAAFGVKPEQILEALGVDHVSEITIDHVARLRAMYRTIKDGEETVETMFGKGGSAPAHETIENPLSDTAPAADGDAGKPADTAPSGAEGGQATAPATETTSPPTTEEAAFERGYAARRKGLAKKPPKDEPIQAKWSEGWDAADAKQEG